jgi:glycerol uptake facilitator protein
MADSDLDRDNDDEGGEAAPRVRRRPFAEIGEPPERGPAAYLAEFVGTFALVFVICTVVMIYAPAPIAATQPGQPPTQPFQDWSVIGLAHGFILFALIQSLAVASGAHFNPAVTAAMTAIRQIRVIDAAIYVAVQLIGGIAGAWVVKLMFDNPNAAGVEPNFGAPKVGAAAAGTSSVAFAAELIGTFLLVWTIVGVAVNPRGARQWAALAIGGTLLAIEVIFGPVSGGAFNPARALGPSLFGHFDQSTGTWILIWVVAPVLGAVLAAFAYVQTIILPGRKGTEGMEPVG